MHFLDQVTDTLGFFNVWATVKGGGIMGQAQALRHGISACLLILHGLQAPLHGRDVHRKAQHHKSMCAGYGICWLVVS